MSRAIVWFQQWDSAATVVIAIRIFIFLIILIIIIIIEFAFVTIPIGLLDPSLEFCCKYRINCFSLTWWIRPRSAIPEENGQMCTKSKKMSQNQKKWTRAGKKWTRAKQLRRQVTDKCCLPVARKCTFCHQELSKPFPIPISSWRGTLAQITQLCLLCYVQYYNNFLPSRTVQAFPIPYWCGTLVKTLLICNIITKLSKNMMYEMSRSHPSWCGTVVPTLWCTTSEQHCPVLKNHKWE